MYLIEVGIDSYLVIKQEVTNRPVDLKYALKTIKTVSPKAAGKLLSMQEMDAIRGMLSTSEYWSQKRKESEEPDVASLRRDMLMGGVWFKMEKAEDLFHLKSAVAQLKTKGDKTGIRAIAASLNKAGGLESLGQIVAVDAYNHNTDRFAPPMAGEKRKQGQYLTIVNDGNVFFSLEQGLHKPIALDPFFASSDFRDVNQTIEHLEHNSVKTWAGRILARGNTDARKMYCKEIIADLEMAFGPRNRKFAMFASQWKRLDSNAADRLFKRMSSGASALTVKLRSMAGKPNCPAGIASRLAIITA